MWRGIEVEVHAIRDDGETYYRAAAPQSLLGDSACCRHFPTVPDAMTGRFAAQRFWPIPACHSVLPFC